MARALLLVVVAACGSDATPVTNVGAGPKPQPVPVVPDEPAVAAPAKPIRDTTLAAVGLSSTAMDRKADPCEDFYQFACGGWIASSEIPADLPINMRSFVDIELRNEAYLHDVLEKARTAPGDDPVMRQVGAFYGACMDEAAIEKAGTKPIAPLLAQIAKVKDTKSLSAAITALQQVGMNPLFDFVPTEDFADATRVIGEIGQKGLGLPDRDYYLKDDARSKELRAAYVDLVAALLVEARYKPAAAKTEAAAILALETELARVSKDRVLLRDPKSIYNKIDRAGVKKAMPHFEWDAFFKALGHDRLDDITVASTEYVAGLDAQIIKTPFALWRSYLTAHVLAGSTGFLTKKLEDLGFKLEQKLAGATEQRARWKRCVAHTDAALGESLGQIYVRDRFAGDSKTAAEQQVKAIISAMGRNIETLPWMDVTTKQRAKDKVASIAHQIGYPATWRTYKFKIDPKTFGANVLAARREKQEHELSKIGKPVDREEWFISPPTVNALYYPTHNKIVFPAGILQSPFYKVDHSIAVNLGAMGMVVGHEVTHGFDDQGSQFDGKGNMANWWQPQTEKQFKQRTQCVIDQYGGYEAAGTKLNGKLTVGENVADIGGVKLALAAYRSLRADAPSTDVADGFTEDQQFFLSFAQAWCSKARPEYEAMLATIDTHSPPRWRVNGTLSATPDFAKAFRCKAGAKLRPQNACAVW